MKAPDELRSFIDTCKVLQYLRNLYIEDFIYKQPLYHKFPAYQHNILKMEELQQYKVRYFIDIFCKAVY